MKFTQYCSVCKEQFAMDVIPTDDGDDDGVMWLRCPQCHGFLPRLGSALADDDETPASGDGSVADTATAAADADAGVVETPAAPASGEVEEPTLADAGGRATDDLATDVLATDVLATGDLDADLDVDFVAVAAEETIGNAADLPVAAADPATKKKAEPPAEDYSAELAAMDVTKAVPYRPGGSYTRGDVVQHLAWDDCGVVVGEEVLPGRRQVIKVAFEKSGVHRLIVESGRS